MTKKHLRENCHTKLGISAIRAVASCQKSGSDLSSTERRYNIEWQGPPPENFQNRHHNVGTCPLPLPFLSGSVSENFVEEFLVRRYSRWFLKTKCSPVGNFRKRIVNVRWKFAQKGTFILSLDTPPLGGFHISLC